ncbi:hypothetical protein F52700_9998 [Fusarium sp. NRRL 52700]|nr:hypothetical protein F52700_9998 [Fusarium sp. NRRL 52700]
MDSGAPQTAPTGNVSGRRRSSGFMPAFASLNEQKRAGDANAARRASMSDQQAKGGLFSQFFHKYVTVITRTLVSDVDNCRSNFGKNAAK